MPRSAVSTPEEMRAAILALLAEAGAGESPSAQSFRRAVSVRKVRERLGGGNPATIGRAINAMEAERVRHGLETVAMPALPGDIAELMTQLWQAAVGVQLEDVLRLKAEANDVADAAREALAEAQLRSQVLQQELSELRAAIAERDSRLAQAVTDGTALAAQLDAQRLELQAVREREVRLLSERDDAERARAEAVTASQARYEGLSKQLLQETAQQRQAAQAEVARLAGQQKFADKREAGLQARLALLDAELIEARAQREQAAGEVSALRYVNASLRAQIDEVMRTWPAAPAKPPLVAGLARGRKRVAPKTASRPPKASS